jgi:DNA-binding beta-propeller fold protein YncE
VTVIDGATLATSSVTVGYVPGRMTVDPVANKIYVVNQCPQPGVNSCDQNAPGTITVIDGATLAAQNVTVGWAPIGVAVNSTTNTIYVINQISSASLASTITVVNGVNLSTQSIPAGVLGTDIAVDSGTNKIYATNLCGNDQSCQSDGTVTVLDGATLTTQSVSTEFFPIAVGVNDVTHKIYVGNDCADSSCSGESTATVIDGATLSTATVPICSVAQSPVDVEVNTVTNQVYLPCNAAQTGVGGIVTNIDGATNNTIPIAVGDGPFGPAIDSARNLLYVSNYGDATVSVIGGATKLQFVPVTPCRLVDTRIGQGGSTIQGGTSESFALPQLGGCNIPTTAAAYSLNVTAVPPGRLGFLTIWPSGEQLPNISLMNSLDGRIKANAAIVPAGVSGAVSVYVTNTSDVLIDIDGYFAPASASTLAFYPLPPCRVVDTRGAVGNLGGPFLTGNQERDFPVLDSSCIPQGIAAQAYSFNVTAVPHPTGQRLGYLTVWPYGEPKPTVSTLNNLTGTIVANAAMVQAGTAGEVAVFPNDDTDLLIDINGYFAAPGQGGLSLYPTPPCRVIDTRNGNGAFMGQMAVQVQGGNCATSGAAQAYILNATVVPQPTLGFLTLWADGQTQPGVSTLNAKDGAITSNLAVVPTMNGSVDAFANDLTQLILDISSYFAP